MRGEIKDDFKSEELAQDAVSVEKQQEMLLLNKLASGGRLPPKTQSNFLQKKLQQRKFFDSGDYAMNQDKEKKHQRQLFPKSIAESAASPPEVNISAPSHQSNESESASGSTQQLQGQLTPTSTEMDSDEEGHLEIPRPETVPKRKASILHPSVHSKLSPQPLFHHEHSDESLTS